MNRRQQELERDEKGDLIMTKANLRLICEKDGLYEFPELNSKIYLHFKGFRKIENLGEFHNLRTLYLENNLITKIENLEVLPNLEHLFLQNNLITKIEGLEGNTRLIGLNLSNNSITEIKNLEPVASTLQSLDISGNHIKDFTGLQGLLPCLQLITLDLSNNHILYDEKLLPEIFSKLVSLKSLYLKNNDFVRECPNFRKSFIGSIPSLTYLEDRPINPQERLISQAFLQGGKEKQKEVLQAIELQKLANKQAESQELRQQSAVMRERRIIYFQKQIQASDGEQFRLKGLLTKAETEQDQLKVSFFQELLDNEKIKQKDLMQSVDDMQKLQGNVQNSEKLALRGDDISSIVSTVMASGENLNDEEIIERFNKIVKDIYSKINKEVVQVPKETVLQYCSVIRQQQAKETNIINQIQQVQKKLEQNLEDVD